VYHKGAHVDKAPFVIFFPASAGMPQYFQPPFAGKIPDMPFESRKMGAAGDRGNDKKIGPGIKAAEIQNNYIGAPVFGKQFPQFDGRFPILP
jgi:hypothetical protein